MEAPYSARRPLKSRGLRFFQELAAFLAKQGATPNGISIVGVVFALLAALAFSSIGSLTGLAERMAWVAGAAMVQLRLVCNLLDGMVAVEHGRATVTGPFFNEAPDRLADVLILLGFAAATQAWVPGLAAALGSVATAYTRVLGAELGVGHCFHGPMAKPHRMAILTLATLVFAFGPATWTMDGVAWVLWLITLGCGITVVRRIAWIFIKLAGSKP